MKNKTNNDAEEGDKTIIDNNNNDFKAKERRKFLLL